MEQGRWKLQDAKARLSELVDRALAGKPQRIMRRGHDAVVVLRVSDYEEATRPRKSLIEFFAASPHREILLDVERNSSLGRDVDV